MSLPSSKCPRLSPDRPLLETPLHQHLSLRGRPLLCQGRLWTLITSRVVSGIVQALRRSRIWASCPQRLVNTTTPKSRKTCGLHKKTCVKAATGRAGGHLWSIPVTALARPGHLTCPTLDLGRQQTLCNGTCRAAAQDYPEGTTCRTDLSLPGREEQTDTSHTLYPSTKRQTILSLQTILLPRSFLS